MAQCPSCNFDLSISDQNFGTLFNCPQCNAVFFVDWNGNPEISGGAEVIVDPTSVVGEEAVVTTQSIEVPLEDPFVSQLQEASPNQENFLTTPVESNLMSEIEAYGNESDSSVPLVYTVIIGGLDSGEMFQALEEALKDSRLGWDFESIIKRTKDGRLVLEDLNPALAVEIVRRIKGLKLDISWSQNVY